MDIEAWLTELGLERYAQAFRDNDIDARSLPHLTSDDLKELGVMAIGHPGSSSRRSPHSLRRRRLD